MMTYWPFNGNSNDESGFGHHGIVFGATSTTDRFGNGNSAYYFDGEADYIDIGNSVKPELPVTISCWVNLPLEVSSWILRNDKWTTFGYYGIYLAVTSEGKINCGVGGGGDNKYYRQQSNTLQPVIAKDNWHHIAVVFNSASDVLKYVDGIAYNSEYYREGTTLVYSSEKGRIGHSSSTWAKGKIDDIRIYNKALAQSEVQALYFEGGWGN